MQNIAMENLKTTEGWWLMPIYVRLLRYVGLNNHHIRHFNDV